jgi:hypothetical protein
MRVVGFLLEHMKRAGIPSQEKGGNRLAVSIEKDWTNPHGGCDIKERKR